MQGRGTVIHGQHAANVLAAAQERVARFGTHTSVAAVGAASKPTQNAGAMYVQLGAYPRPFLSLH